MTAPRVGPTAADLDAYVIAETVRHRRHLTPVDVPVTLGTELRLLNTHRIRAIWGLGSWCSWSPGTPVALQHSQVGDHRWVGRLCLLSFRWRPALPLCHRWPLVGFGRRRRWGSRCLSCGMRCGRGRLAHLLLGTANFGRCCGAGMPCCGSCAAGASTSRKTAWNRIHRSHRIRVTRRNRVTRRRWWRLWGAAATSRRGRTGRPGGPGGAAGRGYGDPHRHRAGAGDPYRAAHGDRGRRVPDVGAGESRHQP